MATAATAATTAPTTTTTNWAPTAKVSAGALAGAGTTLIVGLLKVNHATWFTDTNVVAALTCILTFVIQYLVPERPKGS